ncbi:MULTISPECIES: DEAD/DEAH box helicase [Paenarthrobacter]|uniref:DEAD/DEAH box helicase n=1 Tax=Paenarthrobacter ureafaciens TaxID=37931 RepID=A0AAX3EGH8_PAEUR|nr:MULTISPECIES: DEAD/DEAH box helicase [Paenarthrobacter]NKR11803.1 helicase [Arthrobacter sp. M5]NKR16852.1 helicase [Arthrobacter sp. M6]OEH60497.1 helicase [Arthrobacter sp. D4]OEH61113.1 helicase [Arthrobacter sp. D2]MDO5866051.1 DEAD/DEAH box helicase [Paenarthrobacter sp. SD-2]
MVATPSLIPLLSRTTDPEQLRHVHTIPARKAVNEPWPEWVHPDIVAAYQGLGIQEPYRHQVQAAGLAHSGQHVVIATGTASGKSLAYQLPALDAIHRSELRVLSEPGKLHDDGAVALYLSPTKALAADQLAAVRSLRLPTVRAETYDGDTDQSSRRWIRDHANLILANPDMLHFGILPNHEWWAKFFRRLRYVIVDEAHSYRGVFGSHVANLMRRLRRVCAYYGAGTSFPEPVFIAASATASDPGVSFGRLIGAPAREISEDCSPHGSTTVAFWEPALTELKGENGAKQRRTAVAETADILANLVSSRVRTIAFIKSRRGAESIASITKRLLDEVDPSLPARVAAYRSGYLPEERRALEQALRSGQLLGVSSTSALELGIDISGLDAVLVAGWPGTRASLFQQIGRAGRAGQDALAAFVASDDPLDTYLVNHPQAIFDVSVEATVFDPGNPYVLGPHLCAAAAELPIGPAELDLFGPSAEGLLDRLVMQGYLRKRPAGWFWTHSESAAGMVNLRADGGGPVSIVDAETGSLLGTMDSPQTHYQAHTGAIYVHQGESYLVEELNEGDHCVMVRRVNPDFYTTARDVTQIEVLDTNRSVQWGDVTAHFGEVKVTTQVVSFQRKALISNEILGEEPLDLGARELFTKAVWFVVENRSLNNAGLVEAQFPGALHAAEHAAIGLLPLVASSDRWDIGGVSTALHADTGLPTIFVYDGHPGGAGFAERGFEKAKTWLSATRDAIAACECDAGCPSCVQSPKCGNKNNPLDKAAAITLLDVLLKQAV